MIFEAGKVFIWGDVVFGKLMPKKGGHVALVTRHYNSDEEKFLELRNMPESSVWDVRRGGTDMRGRCTCMYPDNFPKSLSSIVRT
jgi:hypothetical protein